MNASLTPRRIAQLVTAFLLMALAMLLARPTPSLARAKAASCAASAATRAERHVRACAGRHRSSHAHAKVKRHHAKRSHIKKNTGKAKPKVIRVPVATLRPATCEDGSTPARDSEGEYSCGDGSEPICSNGAEPVLARGATRLLCPSTSASGVEFGEAGCENGGAPERVGGKGSYTCQDGSQPSCEDGSQPKLSDDGSMLVCVAGVTPGDGSAGEEGPEQAEAENEATVQGSRAASVA